MKILFAKSNNPVENKVEGMFTLERKKELNELSINVPNLKIDWKGTTKKVDKINFYWPVDQEIDFHDNIKLKSLKGENSHFFELFFDESIDKYDTASFLKEDKLTINFSNGELKVLVNQNARGMIALNRSEKEVGELDCPSSQCKISGGKVVMEFASEQGFYEKPDDYDACFDFQKITFTPRNGLATAQANLTELQKKKENVEIKKINIMDCRLERNNLIVETYESDNLSNKVSETDKIRSRTASSGGEKIIKESDESTSTSQTNAIKQQFLNDLDDYEIRESVKSLFEKHGVDRSKFESKIKDLSENEIIKFYHVEDLFKKIDLSKLENWITTNLNQIKGSTETTTGTQTTESGSTSSADLPALQTSAINAIKASLNQNPPLTNSDLNSEYQDWESKINATTSPENIDTLEKSLLAHIKSQRKNQQTAQNVSENLQKAQNPNATIQDKKEALSNLEQNEGETAYEEKKEEARKIKEEVARDNPAEYRDSFLNFLPNKLTQNELTEAELDTETKTEIENLKNETDSSKIVEKEEKIIQKLGQQGAKKKILNIKKELEKALKLNDKSQIKKIKEKLVNFIHSSNVYFQSQKNEAKKLLKQLEESSQNQNTDNSSKFPWKTVIPTTLAGGGILALFLVIRVKKKENSYI